MRDIPFTTQNTTFRQKMELGNSYQVPPFQRNYSWTENEWDDLWQDIQELSQEQESDAEGASHFMGFLVLQMQGKGHFTIIDGQQRLTTISILILAAIKCLQELQKKGLDPAGNATREKLFQDVYIGNIDPRSLEVSSKLTLNNYNNYYYQNYLVPLEGLPRFGVSESEALLCDAFRWFKKHIDTACGQDQESGIKISSLVETVVSRLFFTTVTIGNESNAFMLFATLNARGVRLSATDLLKNYLYSCLGDAHNPKAFSHIEARWYKILSELGENNFPEFLRTFWNSRHGLVRRNALFKAIHRNIREQSAASQLLRELDCAAPLYAALRLPSQQWNSKEKPALRILKILNVHTPLSLFLACYNKFFEDRRSIFTSIVQATAIITLRNALIGTMPINEQEKIYNDISLKILSGEYTSKPQIFNDLKKLYPDDELFKFTLSRKNFLTTDSKNKKIVRFILFNIERHLDNKQYDINNENYTIEHIFPENPEEHWNSEDIQEFREMTFRLGNMTLLEATYNRALGNELYENKKALYSQSIFLMTRTLVTNYPQWTPEALEDRQRKMTECAAEIWKVQF